WLICLFCLFCWLIILLSRLIRFMSYSCDIWFLSRCWCGCWLRCFFLCANRDDAILVIFYFFSFVEITRYFFAIFSSYFINFLFFSIVTLINNSYFTFFHRTIFYFFSIKSDCFFLCFLVLIHSNDCYFCIFIDVFIKGRFNFIIAILFVCNIIFL